jgi:hypothetical protein
LAFNRIIDAPAAWSHLSPVLHGALRVLAARVGGGHRSQAAKDLCFTETMVS